MIICNICGLEINDHNMLSLQKCLEYTIIYQQRLEDAITKLQILMGNWIISVLNAQEFFIVDVN